MTDAIDNGGPAFPVSDQGTHGTYGMALRDYFAGHALSGLLADSKVTGGYGETIEEFEWRLALRSYAYADAMLAARKGGQ